MSNERTLEVHDAGEIKRNYTAPQILWTEKLTARASQCAQSDASCAPGPIQS